MAACCSRSRGFTLIELMVVVALIALLSAALWPVLGHVEDSANALADKANLEIQYSWQRTYARKHHGMLPAAAGHAMVLAPWQAGIMDHTPENFDRFWTPGPARNGDPRYQELYKLVLSEREPWPRGASTTTLDTHYVGRARPHLMTREQGGKEAWMANDNEGRWSLRDGTIHVLFGSGTVREYSYPQLEELFGTGPFDPALPVVTHGSASPLPACRKLAN